MMIRHTIIAALLGFLLPVIGIMGYNAWQDPFNYYHPIEDSRFSSNSRWQNPGMIRNFDYDTVLIGTSRFENFKPSMFAPAGWKVLKVTAAGSMADEQLDTLEMVLRQGRASRVVIEMSYVSYTAIAQRNPAEFPKFLYRNSLETPFQYLLSYDLLRESLFAPPRSQQPYDDLYVWWPRHKNQFNEATMLAAAVASCQQKPSRSGKSAATRANLDRFERMVAANPQVEFITVFPPMAAISMGPPSSDGQVSAALAKRLDFRTQFAQIARSHSNLILYDYASREEIVLDYSRYFDPGHFDIAFSEQMAREIISATGPLADLNDVNAPLLKVQAQVDVSKLPCLAETG